MQLDCCEGCVALDVPIFELQKLKSLCPRGQRFKGCAFRLDDDSVLDYKSEGRDFSGDGSCSDDLGFRLSLRSDPTDTDVWKESTGSSVSIENFFSVGSRIREKNIEGVVLEELQCMFQKGLKIRWGVLSIHANDFSDTNVNSFVVLQTPNATRIKEFLCGRTSLVFKALMPIFLVTLIHLPVVKTRRICYCLALGCMQETS